MFNCFLLLTSFLDLPTFLHLTVAGRKAITAKKPSNEPAPGPTENTKRTYSPQSLCKSDKSMINTDVSICEYEICQGPPAGTFEVATLFQRSVITFSSCTLPLVEYLIYKGPLWKLERSF